MVLISYLLSEVSMVLGDENTYPQSICSYLQDMLKAWYWADEIVLRAMSIMFNVTITVIRAETGLEVKVRHNRPW